MKLKRSDYFVDSLLQLTRRRQVQKDLRQHFESGALKNIAYRKNQLLSLAYLIYDNASRFEEALAADLHRPGLESQLCAAGGSPILNLRSNPPLALR